jgi:hypothetical protein
MNKKKLTYARALILADELGPEYRVSLLGDDYNHPGNRAKYAGEGKVIFDSDPRIYPLVLGGLNNAIIIRPTNREVSIIEALTWAAQEENREFTRVLSGIVFKYRVKNNNLEATLIENDLWQTQYSIALDSKCTINDIWEKVDVKVVVDNA